MICVFEPKTEISAASGLALEVTGPSPLRDMRRQSGREHDPADGKAAPDHSVVVRPFFAADNGGPEREDFVVGSVSFYKSYEVTVNLASMFMKLASRINPA